ncbi:hypothetical protein ACFFK0_12620 [Paenibacillus chartarius]|uniref:Uncharacterized protein n=1 Tax=Paenibacillus chartarius TaxID=747481 RepID=A0ABV6DKV6_9BACL
MDHLNNTNIRALTERVQKLYKKHVELTKRVALSKRELQQTLELIQQRRNRMYT